MKVAFVCDSGTARNVKELREMGIFSCPLQISDDKILIHYFKPKLCKYSTLV